MKYEIEAVVSIANIQSESESQQRKQDEDA
jgi:hypothetical protein